LRTGLNPRTRKPAVGHRIFLVCGMTIDPAERVLAGGKIA
jgi:hypothetical protein